MGQLLVFWVCFLIFLNPMKYQFLLGLSRLCSATFEQLLAFGATFCGFSNLEQVFVENLNSCEFLEGLSCYQPFEHITCHLTTFRRPNWPIVPLLFMNGNGWREAAFIVYFSHDIDTWFVLSRYSVLQLESE